MSQERVLLLSIKFCQKKSIDVKKKALTFSTLMSDFLTVSEKLCCQSPVLSVKDGPVVATQKYCINSLSFSTQRLATAPSKLTTATIVYGRPENVSTSTLPHWRQHA
jgi:hypothetical protein